MKFVIYWPNSKTYTGIIWQVNWNKTYMTCSNLVECSVPVVVLPVVVPSVVVDFAAVIDKVLFYFK